MAYLNFYRFDELLTKFRLDKSRITIGRGIDNDICIPDQNISRLHFVIERASDHDWRFVDQSRNGTKINGSLTHEHILQNADEIQLSKEWRFLFEPNPSLATCDAPTIIDHTIPTQVLSYNPNKKELTTQQAFLEPQTEGGKKRLIPISKEVFCIGTNRANDLCLEDDFISNFHCKLYIDRDRYVLKDVGSTNGTCSDGQRIKEVFLQSGTLITVGRTSLRFLLKEHTEKIRKSKHKRLGLLFSSDDRMLELFELIPKIAPSNATVCITGESGTGKEVVAQTLHELSLRCHMPFVAVNCATLKAELIESELFGHEKGAFTSAVGTRKGAFETASGGTLFLDEIGELSLDLQPKLLRVLEQNEICRLGSNHPVKIDVRLIVATNRNLAQEVRAGRFREDLFYRIHVLPISLPPLRERKDDIPEFATMFLKFFGEQTGRDLTLTDDAKMRLLEHPWPGNIRELRNMIHRLVLQINKAQIVASDIHFDPDLSPSKNDRLSIDAQDHPTPTLTEKEQILKALDEHSWNKTKAAKFLRMAKSTLYDKILYYGFVSPLPKRGIRGQKKAGTGSLTGAGDPSKTGND